MGNPKKPSAGTRNAADEELHSAARSGNLEAVQRICSANPLTINSRDRHSRTPLHLAAWSGQAKVVEYLCKKADVGAAAMDDMGAIHFAAQKGHLDVVRMLVTSGVSVKSINRKGMTALHYAAQGSHIELAKYLIKKGSNVNAKNKAGKTPVDLATSEELRSVLLNKELSNSKEKDPQAEPNSSSQENEANAGGEVEDGEKDAENEKDESVKRKSDEGRSSSEVMPEAKKSKVSLNHLLAADDTQEEEEEENL
ncbi:hypothetical protein M9H77_25281 [Catharanthus roseus]|uniref:Uncharacterized protein n=1 Tax=Catharanthus roseus TaxID=4058 RepID=A0ACC0A6G1_CATRO|nr:hypothetical protein M9H77_25281 [Catharanthus roseus]